MQSLQPELQPVLQASMIEAELGLDAQQQEIELLREQIQSLKLELCDKNQQLKEVEDQRSATSN